MNFTRTKSNKFLTSPVEDSKIFKCYCSNCEDKNILCNLSYTPIISVGIIAYFYDKNIKDFKFVMINRRDSLGYVDLIRGKYNINNKKYILNLVNEMTLDEKENILTYPFETLWNNLWNKRDNIDYHSKAKFDNILPSLVTIIRESFTNWEEAEWGFPKGRKNYKESDYNAGLREFVEETGIPKEELSILQNIRPFEECFIGSNFKTYKHKYYLAKLSRDDIDLTKFQKSEVSQVKLFTHDECMQHIRFYNKEKHRVITNVYNVLNNYEIS